MWDPSICIDCGKCAIVCPHDAIQMKVFEPGAPDTLQSKDFRSRDLPTQHRLTIQVAPDDCTGCGVCVEQCPAHDKQEVGRSAIMMSPAAEHRERERANFAFFERIPPLDRSLLASDRRRRMQGHKALCPMAGRS